MDSRQELFAVERRELDIICPACFQETKAIAYNGIVEGKCFKTSKQVFLKVD